MEYEFTLTYHLADKDSDPDTLLVRLAEAGCDDALVGLGTPGRITLNFAREAPSAPVAMLSALEDVKRAIPSAKLIEAAPDIVGLTDVAELIGMTRQGVRKLTLQHATTFPLPIHTGSAALYHLADVLSWLEQRQDTNRQMARAIKEISEIAKQVNVAKAAKELSWQLHDRISAYLT
jgi:hypothetical protein